MMLEQIVKKTDALQEALNSLTKLRDLALSDHESMDPQKGRTMGLKLHPLTHARLALVSKKYGLRGKKHAALLVIQAGCRLLLTESELRQAERDVRGSIV